MLDLIRPWIQMSSVNEGTTRHQDKIVMGIRWRKTWEATSTNVPKSSEMFIISLLLVCYYHCG